MKAQLFCGAMLAALLLAALVTTAQTKPGDVVAYIPFSFVVADRVLPPGSYIVSAPNDVDLRIYNSQNPGVFVPAHRVQRSTRKTGSKVVFHRYGDTYFLSQVWVGTSTTGRELFRPAAERALVNRGAEREIALVTIGK